MNPIARPSGLFVTGTDTGVGKTLVASALIQLYAARGWRAAGMKPVASGAFRDGAAAWRWGEAGRRVRRFAGLIMRAGGRRRGAGAAKKGPARGASRGRLTHLQPRQATIASITAIVSLGSRTRTVSSPSSFAG
mgnify:CR=1 FL=1